MRAAVLIGAALLASAGAADAGGYGGRAIGHASERSTTAGPGRSGVTTLAGRGVYNGYVAGGDYPGQRRVYGARRGYGPAIGYGFAAGLGAYGSYAGYGGYGGPAYGSGGYEGAGAGFGGIGYGGGYAPMAAYGARPYTVSGEGAYAYGYNGYAETPALPYAELQGAPPPGPISYAPPMSSYGAAQVAPSYPARSWPAPGPCGC